MSQSHIQRTAARKSDHIRICVEEDVESGLSTGLEDYRFVYDALPELDLEAVDTSCELLGRRLAAPLLVGAITGGTDEAGLVNRNLAEAAERLGIGLCLGSQRAMLEDQGRARTYDVRASFPGIPLLLGNLGAVQLNYGVDAARIRRGLELVPVDGLVFHLNPLQEAIQPEGDTNFAGLREKLAAVLPELPVPCLVKEVGAGISAKTAEKLASLPLAGVEAAGVGGTSWAKVEAYRAVGDPVRLRAGQVLAGFGVPTAEAIRVCRAAFGDRVVIGSGGIRNGLDMAKAIALGADVAAMARPLVQAAVRSAEAVAEYLEATIFELKVVMFCIGAATVEELKKAQLEMRTAEGWRPLEDRR